MLELIIHRKVRPFLLMMSLSVQEGSLLLVVLLVSLCSKLVYELKGEKISCGSSTIRTNGVGPISDIGIHCPRRKSYFC
ncbi:hypothetical protein GIB67_000070 [Kingdonia uniflora]|uniref:Uncharacterized protein n=1 Tax=Kingdonia uniflora TaxID=39325 RepID=A0A7J7M7Z8_9MAGN|nr:hypothetical protein GIB67_000070 [Kingdonia uniflora]